jgi:Transposase IS116/IS110/IS902 family
LVAPHGKWKLKQFLNVLMDEQGGANSSPRIALLVADARAQWAELDRRIAAFDAEFVRWAKENEEARRLTTIPGIGAIVASALVAAVGQAGSFERGRDLAAWLGLVPRQFTTGGKPKLLRISKRGNKYLRRQIHGARAALPYVAERDTARPVGEGPHEPRPSQRRGRSLRQQPGPDRPGDAAARGTVCRRRNVHGGVEAWSFGAKRRTVKKCLREGDDEMA